MSEPAEGAGPGGAHARVSYVIARLDRAIRREIAEMAAPHGLTATQFTALSVLRTGKGLSNAQLARRSYVTPQSMIEMLGTLENKGLVQRAPAPDHGRIMHVELTGEGAARAVQVRRGDRPPRGQDDERADARPSSPRSSGRCAAASTCSAPASPIRDRAPAGATVERPAAVAGRMESDRASYPVHRRARDVLPVQPPPGRRQQRPRRSVTLRGHPRRGRRAQLAQRWRPSARKAGASASYSEAKVGSRSA